MKIYAIINFEDTIKGLKACCYDQQGALQMLRHNPGSRMMTFPSANDMFHFVTHRLTNWEDHQADAHTHPIPQEGVIYDISYDSSFIEAILVGDHRKVWLMITSVPTLLINDMSHPRIYNARGENALHIAARVGSLEICSFILEVINSPMFIAMYQGHTTPMTYAMSEKLLELYLNSPERHNYDTPLHLAAQFGWPYIVRMLLTYPQCEIKQNKWGLRPQDIICVRATRAHSTRTVRNGIANMLGECYFVPLIRTEFDMEPPYIGEPFSRKSLPNLFTRAKDKLALRKRITAFVGPMSHSHAVRVYKIWKYPPRLIPVAFNRGVAHGSSSTGSNPLFLCSVSRKLFNKSNMSQAPGYVMRDFRKTNLAAGLERIGRHLAKVEKVQWREYWGFLNLYCNLAERFGLHMFEMYLEHRVQAASGALNSTTIAIDGCLSNKENQDALLALKYVHINQAQFPLVNRWRNSLSHFVDSM